MSWSCIKPRAFYTVNFLIVHLVQGFEKSANTSELVKSSPYSGICFQLKVDLFYSNSESGARKEFQHVELDLEVLLVCVPKNP